ncbi:MAG: hypothetical protein ACLSUW_10930 [Akkermansia sp.]
MRFIALFFIFLLQIAWAEEPWKIAIIGDTRRPPHGSEGVAVNFIGPTERPEALVDRSSRWATWRTFRSAPSKAAKRKELNKCWRCIPTPCA